MPKIQIRWDDASIEHIAGHNVEPDEVDSLLTGRYLLERGRKGKYYALGQSKGGRYLFVVLAPLGGSFYRVVTARNMTIAERRRFLRKV